VPKLLGLIRGDLDWIVMKCLEKDRTRRYETANGLAMDLERHLKDEPVTARPPGSLYRFQKMVRRNKLAFGAATAVALALGLGIIGSTWQALRARRAQLAALRERQQALTEAQRAEAASVQAKKAQAESDGLLALIQARQVEELFDTGRPQQALASLGGVLRRFPTNLWAAQRMVSALSHRNFALPLIAPLQHSYHVLWAQLSPNDERVVTVAADCTARVWDAHTGRPLTPPLGHKATINAVQFSPDSQRILTASADMTTRVWDTQNGVPITEWLVRDHPVHIARFTPGAHQVVTCSNDGEVRVWEVANGKASSSFHCGEGYMTCLSSDCRAIATALTNNAVSLFDVSTGQRLRTLQSNDGHLFCLEFSHDGKRLVTAGSGSTATVWDAQTGIAVTPPLNHSAAVIGAHFSADGSRLVTIAEDSLVSVWDCGNSSRGQPMVTLKHQGAVYSAQFSHDGMKILTCSKDGAARIWDSHSGEPLSEPITHGGADVFCAQFSADGNTLVTGAADRTARLWDIRQGAEQSPLVNLDRANGQERVLGIIGLVTECLKGLVVYDNVERIEPEGAAIPGVIVFGPAFLRDPDFERLIRPHFGRPLTPERLERLLGDILDYSWSRDHLAVDVLCPQQEAAGGTIQVAVLEGAPLSDPDLEYAIPALVPPRPRLSRPKDLLPLQAEAQSEGRRLLEDARRPDGRGVEPERFRLQSALQSGKYSPDGARVVVAETKRVIVHDARTDEVLSELALPAQVYSVQFSPDGTLVAIASRDNMARLWDTRHPPSELKHSGVVHWVQFSPDGKTILTASADHTAALWGLREAQRDSPPKLETFRHENWVYCAQFSPSGHKVVTASADGTARVWGASNGLAITEPLKHASLVYWASFSPDERYVVTASEDKTARVWNAETGQPIGEPLKHGRPVYFAEFSQDGGRIVTASGQGTLKFWDFARLGGPAPNWLAALAEAVAGQRVNEQGVLEVASQEPAEVVTRIRQQLAQESANDDWVIWGRWFLADRSARAISPFSKVSTAEYNQQRAQEEQEKGQR
jgi:WD40 repeat protein